MIQTVICTLCLHRTLEFMVRLVTKTAAMAPAAIWSRRRKKPAVNQVVQWIGQGKQQQLTMETMWVLQGKSLKQLLVASATTSREQEWRYLKISRLYDQKSRLSPGYTRRGKPLRQAGICQEVQRWADKFRDKVLWTDEAKFNLYRSGKVKVWRKSCSSSQTFTKPGGGNVMARAQGTTSETDSFTFNDDVRQNGLGSLQKHFEF